jgi:hypothetical protein
MSDAANVQLFSYGTLRAYEVSDYVRVAARLKSGVEAFAYVRATCSGYP